VEAALKWIMAIKRDYVVRTHVNHCKSLMMHLFRHSTGTINLTSTLVHFALSCYIFEKSFFTTKRDDLIGLRSSPDKSAVKRIEAQVHSFVVDQCKQVQEMLASGYEKEIAPNKSDISAINRKVYDTPLIIDQIIAAAREKNLDVGCTYCVSQEGDICFLRTNICIGIYPDFPEKNTKPELVLDNSLFQPRWISSIPSTMKFPDIVRLEGDTILHRNPIMTASVLAYLRDWFSQIPLFSCGVLMLRRLGMDAEVDTSNNLQESMFKVSKFDKDRLLHSSDPGLFTMWKDKKTREQNKKWAVQLRALGFEVKNSNY
jgi:hypothetical protein